MRPQRRNRLRAQSTIDCPTQLQFPDAASGVRVETLWREAEDGEKKKQTHSGLFLMCLLLKNQLCTIVKYIYFVAVKKITEYTIITMKNAPALGTP